jgi:hypothetical protein
MKRRSGFRGKTNFITPRFFEEQASQNKQRIRNRTGFDLRNHIFEYALPREKKYCSLERLWLSLRNVVRRTTDMSSIGIATFAACFFRRSAAVATVGLGCWVSRVFSPLAGAEFSILVPAIAVAAAPFSRRLVCRVMVVMIRRAGFSHPCGQKLQIQEVARLDGRSAHHVHLLERQLEANAKLNLVFTTTRN